MKRCLFFGLAILITALSSAPAAWAQQKETIALEVVAEQEKTEFNEEGKKELTRVPVARVIPGDEVIYTLHYTNKGQEPADNVNITDPVPEHMTYTEGSATGEDTLITFSVDNGETYDSPEKLMVVSADGQKRPAKGSDYTHIRWTLKNPLASGAKGQVAFRARLN